MPFLRRGINESRGDEQNNPLVGTCAPSPEFSFLPVSAVRRSRATTRANAIILYGMKRRDLEITDHDPTGEEPAVEFDGTGTDVLDDTYRMRVVAASENSAGAVDFDDRGQARWKWITETNAPSDPFGRDVRSSPRVEQWCVIPRRLAGTTSVHQPGRRSRTSRCSKTLMRVNRSSGTAATRSGGGEAHVFRVRMRSSSSRAQPAALL